MAKRVKSENKLLLRALRGETLPHPPIWLMRQAGRYLPEYMKTRGQANGFLDLCYTPDLAVEVTLQPIRRYGFDASILFSDILVVPHALGQKVWFEEGVGPKLEALTSGADLESLGLDGFHEHLAPVYETVGRLREELPAETALIGFAGAPWTVASYMLEGGSSKDFGTAKTWAYSRPEDFRRVIELLVEATSSYLIRQIEAGAEVVQLFDSWAGVWPEKDLRRWCLEPCQKIIANIKAVHPDIPVILFPRGVGLAYLDFARESGAQGLGLDTTVPLDWARDHLQSQVTLQGNLDPIKLVAGGDALKRAVADIREALAGGPFIFNLGHGIVPQTPPEHVEQLMKLVRA
ncbi:uroporphyrinogen decarboxylase [Denitrobaculum tricleocarpae]|uniref:Uroporphyrinogen decarboxylase n=1 Tax=Denitrobaculum tricleocarpae TaxID=2591009 RepID=A0A545TRI5_9PROT|nr:uroporphyrinogen decarboxylase [Denitrobaculum tricleocarpae]TQV79835.1 uroporphyrinogen decarboxylase [Denitrobaculum tricleocarpae]